MPILRRASTIAEKWTQKQVTRNTCHLPGKIPFGCGHVVGAVPMQKDQSYLSPYGVGELGPTYPFAVVSGKLRDIPDALYSVNAYGGG